MSTFKARGIVLKETLVNDKDKSLNILFKDLGKLNIWARNSINPKSKLFYGSTPFSYADFIIYDNGKNFLLNEIDLIENFYTLTKNLDKLAYATYFLEIVDKVVMDNISCNEIALLLLRSLSTLTKNTPITPKLIAKIFELKLLQLNGYMPNIKNCIFCSKKSENIYKVFFAYQGLVCESCVYNEKDVIQVDVAVIHIMEHVFNSDLSRLYTFNTNSRVLKNLSLISKKLMTYNLHFNLKSKGFINEIENM